MRFAFRPLLGALVLSFVLVGCDAAGPDAMSASLATSATAEAAKAGSNSQSVNGPSSMKPGATCTFSYSSSTPATGWAVSPSTS